MCNHISSSYLAIYLSAGRLAPRTLSQMPPERRLVLHILETVLAYPQSRHLPVFIGVGGEIPGVNLVATDLDLVDVLDFSEGFVLLLQGCRGRVHVLIRLDELRKRGKHGLANKVKPTNGRSGILKGGVPLSRTFSTALVCVHEDACGQNDKKGVPRNLRNPLDLPPPTQLLDSYRPC